MGNFKRVPGLRYLYRRGDSLVFRRGIPPYAREVFGGRTEVQLSLGTQSITDARYRLSREIAKFEVLLSRAKGQRHGERLQPRLPSKIEIDEVVREWLSDRLKRAQDSQPVAIRDDEWLKATIGTLDRHAADVKQGLRSNRAAITTTWIAEAIIEDYGWDIQPDTILHLHLLRMIGRGQREAASRMRQDVEGEPMQVLDETFSLEEYQRDERRQAERSNLEAISIHDMFDGYVREKQPKPSTVRAWRRQIDRLADFLGHDNVRQISPDDMLRWKNHLLTAVSASGERLTATTVKDTYLAAAKTVLGWAKENRFIHANPVSEIRVRTPKRIRRRDPGFSSDEATLILKATNDAPAKQLSPERAFARRWVPWLCAYTGARVNEITQLRREDVFREDEVWLILITPDAGTVKNNCHRKVAIHPAILDRGFIDEINKKSGPLFFDPSRRLGGSDENPQPKKVGEYIAQWVRKIGVVDPDLQPNHAWRHRFKTLARRYGMDAEVRDAIQGHVPRTEGEGYGDIPPDVLDRAIRLLPMPDFQI